MKCTKIINIQIINLVNWTTSTNWNVLKIFKILYETHQNNISKIIHRYNQINLPFKFNYIHQANNINNNIPRYFFFSKITLSSSPHRTIPILPYRDVIFSFRPHPEALIAEYARIHDVDGRLIFRSKWRRSVALLCI